MDHMDDPLYDNIAAFAAGLVANGVTEVVISPGSRSTPLSITLHGHPKLRSWIQLDERSAGFFALGMARITGRPAVLVCTSGTAAANYLPAVVEAHHSGIPMIVCTADRPPELQDWGAGQTIDQRGIYGSTTRWAAHLPVAGEWTTPQAERTAMRAVAAASGIRPGPVHLNWPFRLPLEPVVAPSVRDPEFVPFRSASSAESDSSAWADLIDEIAGVERGVIVVGPSDGVGLGVEHATATAIRTFAESVQWPVLAEPLTQLRRGADAVDSTVIATADHLLRDQRFSESMVPEVVVRIGRAPTTKSVRLWIERHRPSWVVLIDPSDHWHDPSFTLTDHVIASPAALLGAYVGERDPGRSDWLDAWRRADRLAAEAIDTELAAGPLLAALTARTLVESLPEQAVLVTSNSMSVRDLDSFVPVGAPSISVIGNRGASGIDGITSTALGAAAVAEPPVVMLIGDLALLHDLGALPAARRLGLHLTAVCVDNDGGEIFSMLPIADHVADADFDSLFRTSHGLDLADLDGFGGIRVSRTADSNSLSGLIAESLGGRRPGIDLIVVAVEHDDDVAQHRRVTAAVASALAS